jgi:alpha-N-acetylglucosamine transferase
MKHTFTSKKKTNKPKYCCYDRKNKSQCVKIKSTLNLTKKNNTNNTNPNTNPNPKLPKYAICTLLFGNDSYLPGIILLGSSILKVMPKNYKKYITLCCMVTKEISTEARNLILNIYDKIIEVEYLQVPPNLIKHHNPNIRDIYAKTITKLRVYEMTDYDKVLFMDADMLVIKNDIFSLFNLRTPALVFMGRLSNNPTERYFQDFKINGPLFNKYQHKYCYWKNKMLHGNLIPYDSNEAKSNGLNIETSLMLISPDKSIINKINKYIEYLIHKKIKIYTELSIVTALFKNKIYAIEPRFFGRWGNPEIQPELVIIDLYGSQGKPWDITKITKIYENISEYDDVSYWWKTYISTYKTHYKHYKNKMLDDLYNTIITITK